MKFYSAYDGREEERSALFVVGDFGESLCVASQAEDADLNVLMKRFGVTGKMPENVRIPSYGDFSEIRDFRSAIEAVREAEAGFMEIPAEVRSRFNNDPQMFLEFCSNPANLPAMRQLGLLREESGSGDRSGDGGAGAASRADAAAAGGGAGNNAAAVGGGSAAAQPAAGAAGGSAGAAGKA